MSQLVPQLFRDMRGKRAQQDGERLQDGTLGAVTQLVQGNHEGRYGGIVGEGLNVFLLLADELVQGLQLLLRGLLVRHQPLLAVPEQAPELLQEAVYAVNALGIPGLGLLDGAQEHLVQTQGIGPTLYMLLDIFSMAQPQIYSPSSRMNSASL